MERKLREDSMCFGCSPKNPIGLKLVFQHEGEVCRARFVAGPEHQGWSGVMHGGLIATLLDEVMAQWPWVRGITMMTAEMTTRYSKAVPIGEELTVEGALVAERGRLIEMAGKIILPDGTVAARATAKYIKVEPERVL